MSNKFMMLQPISSIYIYHQCHDGSTEMILMCEVMPHPKKDLSWWQAEVFKLEDLKWWQTNPQNITNMIFKLATSSQHLLARNVSSPIHLSLDSLDFFFSVSFRESNLIIILVPAAM